MAGFEPGKLLAAALSPVNLANDFGDQGRAVAAFDVNDAIAGEPTPPSATCSTAQAVLPIGLFDEIPDILNELGGIRLVFKNHVIVAVQHNELGAGNS